jgi:hypothetical protein
MNKKSSNAFLGEGAKATRPDPLPPDPLPQSLKRGGEGRLKGGCGTGSHRRPACGPPALSSNILLLLLLVALALLGGCGKKMPPLAPDTVLPGPVREFRLVQEGEGLLLSWLLPRENLLGQPLTQVQGCRVFRAQVKGVETAPPPPSEYGLVADIDLAYPRVGQVQGERVVYRDVHLMADRRYWYRVAAYDQGGYLGAWSRVLSHAWGRLPRAPKDLKAKPGDKLVNLSWSPVTQLTDGSPVRDLAGYRIYRRSGDGAWLKVTPGLVPQSSFQDLAVLNDVEYTYKIRAQRKVGPDFLESGDSPTRMAMPEKLAPPPPLINVVAVAGKTGVELRWDPSPAPDLAGYRIYRRGPGEERLTLLNRELVTKPRYVDTLAVKGKTYSYYVTAVDQTRRANESLPSEEATITY